MQEDVPGNLRQLLEGRTPEAKTLAEDWFLRRHVYGMNNLTLTFVHVEVILGQITSTFVLPFCFAHHVN